MQYPQTLIFTLLVSLNLAGNAVAACDNDSETLFHCLTKNGKQIEVCDAGKTIKYSFGKPGKTPELAIAAKRDDASTWQWQGVGRYMSYSINIPNGEHNYNVFWGVDRLTEEHAEDAGVNVEKNGATLATVNCKAGTVIQNLEGVDLKPAE